MNIGLASGSAVYSDYPAAYLKAGSASTREDVWESARKEEQRYRELFAVDPTNEVLANKFVHLFPVFQYLSTLPNLFNRVSLCPERNPPSSILFPLNPQQRIPDGGQTISRDIEEFRENFHIYTEGALRLIDWNNVVVAGGAVLASLLCNSQVAKSNLERRRFYREGPYKKADIDLFLIGYGPGSEDQAKKKMVELFNQIQEALPLSCTCFRTSHTVTIVSQFPYKHIQIVLRLYQSPAEVLIGFDLDAR